MTLLAIILVLSSTPPQPDPKLPSGVTCEMVRDIVAQVGRFRPLALAITNGASAAQIREAKKCLK